MTMELNPGALYLTGEDHLRVSTFGSVGSVTLALEGRLVDLDGAVHPFAEAQLPNSDRTVKQSFVTLAAGWLSNMHARVTAGTVKRGQLYVVVELVRGRGATVQSLGTLLQGYVASNVPLAWPGAPNMGSLDGPGAVRAIVGTDPAAGVEIVETVPTGARWRLRQFIYTLVTSAAVANRVPVLTIDDGANVVWEAASNVNQTASQTAKYRAGVGVPLTTFAALAYLLPLPSDLWLSAGFRIRTVTALLDAGDNYSAPNYSVEEWIEP